MRQIEIVCLVALAALFVLTITFTPRILHTQIATRGSISVVGAVACRRHCSLRAWRRDGATRSSTQPIVHERSARPSSRHMRERNILLSSRRTALLGAAALSVPVLQPPLPAFGLLPPLSPRLDASSLTPLASLVPSVAGELRYPSWMLGTWRVTNTVSSFTMPLGVPA